METAKELLVKYLDTQDSKFFPQKGNKGFFFLEERKYNVEFKPHDARALSLELDGLHVTGASMETLRKCATVAASPIVSVIIMGGQEINFKLQTKVNSVLSISQNLELLKEAEEKFQSKLATNGEGITFQKRHTLTEKKGRIEHRTYLHYDGRAEEDENTRAFENFLEGLKENENPSTFEFKKGTGAGFSTVAGMDELKAQIRRDYIDLFIYQDLAKTYGITPPNGMLLYGPPGCGKTFIAERTADATYMNYALISPSDLGSSFLHGSEENIRSLFDEAEKKAPCMLIFDEFDALCPARGTVGTEYQSEEINEFLVHLNNCASKGVYVIAMTNHPERIDHAVLRKGRMDKCIYVPEPDTNTREKLFELSLKERPCSQKIDFKRLALLTEHYSCSDIDYIVKEAARKCFEETISGCRRNRKRISQQVLEATIAETLPSVSAADIKKYEKTRHSLNDREAITKGRRTIGF